jgi:hypothetical protein
MNRFLSPLAALAFTVIAGQAAAQSLQVQVPQDIEPARSGLTRAEVLADLHLYRASGLYDLTRRDQPQYNDSNSYNYRKAYATYLHLRQSPQYAELVRQLEQNPNAHVVAKRTSGPLTQAAN